MQRMTFLALVVALGAAVGCKNQKQQAELAPVPGPSEQAMADPYAAGMSDPYAASGPVAVAPEPVVIAPAGGSYTIAKGDTLWSIAKREYGDGQRWKDIANANPGINPSKLRVGQSITLP